MQADLSPKAAEIVACARSLIAAGGYNGFSYADISDAVHISKASVHHHFASKAELVVTVVQQYRHAAHAAVAELERLAPEPMAQLQGYVGHWAACIRDGSMPMCICAMLAAEMPAIPDEVAAEVRTHFVGLAAWLASVLRKGSALGVFELRAGAESEALMLMSTVHGAMLSARALGNPDVFAKVVEPALRRLRKR